MRKIAILLVLCGCTSTGFDEAEKIKAEARLAEQKTNQAIVEARQIPNLPDFCRDRPRAGIRNGENLQSAIIRYDRALTRAGSTISKCAEWYDNLQRERSPIANDQVPS